MADNPAGKDFYLKTAVDVAVDFRSWLAEWVLVDLVKSEDITAASNDLLAFAKDFGAAEAAAEGEKEIEAIASNATKKLCDLNKEGKANTVWGHDYASGLLPGADCRNQTGKCRCHTCCYGSADVP